MTTKMNPHERPIKTCHECWAAFNRHEWRALKSHAPPEGTIEHKACGVCGEALTLETEGLDAFDLAIDPLSYAQRYPLSARPRRALGDIEAIGIDRRARRRRTNVRIFAGAVVGVLLGLLVHWLGR